jgi:hypothetical protein
MEAGRFHVDSHLVVRRLCFIFHQFTTYLLYIVLCYRLTVDFAILPFPVIFVSAFLPHPPTFLLLPFGTN